MSTMQKTIGIRVKIISIDASFYFAQENIGVLIPNLHLNFLCEARLVRSTSQLNKADPSLRKADVLNL
jgi:hypothetical protein